MSRIVAVEKTSHIFDDLSRLDVVIGRLVGTEKCRGDQVAIRVHDLLLNAALESIRANRSNRG